MFLSLGIIIILGFLGGILFEKIRLPRLVWYLILGILIGPSVLDIIDKDLLNISSYLRQIALVIILTRSGLSLDIETLKKIGRPAILMCFVPATFEIIGVSIFGPLLLNISYMEALLLGSVLAAVSPAVVVPRMIKISEEGINNKNVEKLVMAGASCDDIYVIVLFYAFKGFVTSKSLNALSIALIPISIILGIILGILLSIILIIMFKRIKNNLFKIIILLGTSLFMLGIENALKEYISISSLIGIMAMGILVTRYLKDDTIEIKKSYNSLWQFFEILLFVLVGCATNIEYAISMDGLIIIGLLVISLLFRSMGVIVCLLFTNFNFKEKIFVIISYLPKATVQASIGAIALEEGLSCGRIVLTGAVISILITAPLGAILIDNLYKKLITSEDNINSEYPL